MARDGGCIDRLIEAAVDAEWKLIGIIELLDARDLAYHSDPDDLNSAWCNPDEDCWGKGWRRAALQLSAALDDVERGRGERLLTRRQYTRILNQPKE